MMDIEPSPTFNFHAHRDAMHRKLGSCSTLDMLLKEYDYAVFNKFLYTSKSFSTEYCTFQSYFTIVIQQQHFHLSEFKRLHFDPYFPPDLKGTTVESLLEWLNVAVSTFPPNMYYNGIHINLSRCGDVSLDIIKRFPGIPWDPKYISANRGITMRDIEENPEFPWDFDCVSLNPNITLAFVRKYKDKLNWNNLLQNSFLRQNTANVLSAALNKLPYYIIDLVLDCVRFTYGMHESKHPNLEAEEDLGYDSGGY